MYLFLDRGVCPASQLLIRILFLDCGDMRGERRSLGMTRTIIGILGDQFSKTGFVLQLLDRIVIRCRLERIFLSAKSFDLSPQNNQPGIHFLGVREDHEETPG
jgi:hypothetical protein